MPAPYSPSQKKKENYVGREFLPTSIKGKETRWLRRAVSLLHHKFKDRKGYCGPRGASRGNKLVGIPNWMSMKLLSKLSGTLVIQSKLYELLQGMFSVDSPTNT
eukprot:1136898-Pelagomonas_calceolata.AAC.2